MGCSYLLSWAQLYSGGSVDGAALLGANKSDICLNWSGKSPTAYVYADDTYLGETCTATSSAGSGTPASLSSLHY